MAVKIKRTESTAIRQARATTLWLLERGYQAHKHYIWQSNEYGLTVIATPGNEAVETVLARAGSEPVDW